MAALAGYKGDVYIIDDTSSFSASFTTEATTESGVTKKYQIDAAKKFWDINYPVTVAGYWAFQEFGLSTTSGASSGLSTTTQYYFKIAIDGGAVTEYDITTAGDVTWGAIVALIDAQITGDGATCEFIDGDVRIHSDDVTASSDIACSAGTTGTSLFGQGSVPAVASLETVDYTDIGINTVGYGHSGIRYATGIVQMTHTGFTSLTVTGKYHTLKQVGQLQSFSLTMNYNTADITDYQDTWKANTPTTKNGSLSIEGFYADDEYFTLQTSGILLFRLYTDYSNTLGFYVYGVPGWSMNCTPHEVVRESLSFEVVGEIEYFTS